MTKLLQINVTSNWGSTGRIAEDCNIIAKKNNWHTFVAFGRYSNPSESNIIRVGNKLSVYEHYFENIIFDNEGLASRRETIKLVEVIKEINPDIIHLHNIHDHWLNYPILFEFLNKTNIKVVYTFHDFWAITGGCAHFVRTNCMKWQNECSNCPQRRSIIDGTNRNFILKRKYIGGNVNLTVVAVSEWVGSLVKKSFLNNKNILVIPNAVDTSVFKPTYKLSGNALIDKFDNKFVIMAVSSQWKSAAKGLNDFIELSKLLSSDEVIVLVGVSESMMKKLPNNIIGIKRTNNQQELAYLYTRADVVVSFSSAETFGLTIIEGYACGTPAVVYDNTAPPSLITSGTGFVVENHNYRDAYIKIQEIRKNGKAYYSKSCIDLVNEKYRKEQCYQHYMDLYESLVKQ